MFEHYYSTIYLLSEYILIRSVGPNLKVSQPSLKGWSRCDPPAVTMHCLALHPRGGTSLRAAPRMDVKPGVPSPSISLWMLKIPRCLPQNIV